MELLDTALRLFKEGRYQAVIDRINRLLDLEPAQADALLLLVQCQFALGNYAEATEALAAALANAPKYDWGKYARGYQKVFPSVLRFTLHLRALERFTEAHPERSEGHLLLGYQYASLGEFDRALAEFARARPSVEADRLASHFAEVRDAPAPVPDPELNAEPEAGKVPLKRRGQEF